MRELPPQSGEIFVVGKFSCLAFFRIDVDQIDIGQNIQLVAAELAHADHDQFLGKTGFLADGGAVVSLLPWRSVGSAAMRR